jgi:hypothetical protein
MERGTLIHVFARHRRAARGPGAGTNIRGASALDMATY